MKPKLAFLFLFSLAVAVTGCGVKSSTFHGTVLEPPLSVTDYALVDQNGETVRLGDYRDSMALLFFGYTHCPDACPTTLAQFKQIRGALGADQARVHFVLVTVDPDRDTPAQMKQYLSNFDSSFVGLTATPDTLAQVYRTFGISVEKIIGSQHSHGGTSNLTAHTSSLFLLDDEGQVRLIYTDAPWQDVAADLRTLLKEPE